MVEIPHRVIEVLSISSDEMNAIRRGRDRAGLRGVFWCAVHQYISVHAMLKLLRQVRRSSTRAECTVDVPTVHLHT